jgi:hypothetical protein
MLECFVCERTRISSKCRRCRVAICSAECGKLGWKPTSPHRAFCADLSLAVEGYVMSVRGACEKKPTPLYRQTISADIDDVMKESLLTYRAEEERRVRFGNPHKEGEAETNGDARTESKMSTENNNNATSDIVKNARRLVKWLDECSIPPRCFASQNMVDLESNSGGPLAPKHLLIAKELSDLSDGMDFVDFVRDVLAPVIHPFGANDRVQITTATRFQGRIVVRRDDVIVDQVQSRMDAIETIWDMRIGALYSVNLERASVVFEETEISYSLMKEFAALGVRRFSFSRTRVPHGTERQARRRLEGKFTVSVDDFSVLDEISEWLGFIERVEFRPDVRKKREACGGEFILAIDNFLREKHRANCRPLSREVTICPPEIAGGWDFVEWLVTLITSFRTSDRRREWPMIGTLTVFDASNGIHSGDAELMVASLMSIAGETFEDGDRELVNSLSVVGNESDWMVTDQLLGVLSPLRLAMTAPRTASFQTLANLDFGRLVELDISAVEPITVGTMRWCSLVFDAMRGKKSPLKRLRIPVCWKPEHWKAIEELKALSTLLIGHASVPLEIVDVPSLETMEIEYCQDIDGLLSAAPKVARNVSVCGWGVSESERMGARRINTQTRRLSLTLCTKDRHRMDEKAFLVFTGSSVDGVSVKPAITTTTTVASNTETMFMKWLIKVIERFHFLDTLSIGFDDGTIETCCDPGIAMLATNVLRTDRLPLNVVARGDEVPLLSYASLYFLLCRDGGKISLECKAIKTRETHSISVAETMRYIKMYGWSIEKTTRSRARCVNIACDDCNAALETLSRSLSLVYVGMLERLKIARPEGGETTDAWCRDATLLASFFVMGRLPTEGRLRVSVAGKRSRDTYDTISDVCAGDGEVQESYEKLESQLVVGPIPKSSEKDEFREGKMVVLKTRLEVEPRRLRDEKLAPDAYPNSTTVRWFAMMKRAEGIDATASLYECELSEDGVNIGGSSLCVPGKQVPECTVRLVSETHAWEPEVGTKELILPERWGDVICRWEVFHGKPIWKRVVQE